MSFREKLNARRLLNGGLILGAIALAWAVDRVSKPEQAPLETYPAGWTVNPESVRPQGFFRFRWLHIDKTWDWWSAVLVETYNAMNRDRLLAVAAGVVFYALLAIFPAITAFVSSYGLFAKASAIQDDLSTLSNVLAASISCVNRSCGSQPSQAASASALRRVCWWRSGAPMRASRR